MASESQSRLSLPVILLAMLAIAVCGCGFSGAIFTTMVTSQADRYQQPALETFTVSLLFCGGLGLVMAIPAMLIASVLFNARNHHALASSGTEAAIPVSTDTRSADNRAITLGAAAALAGSLICGLAVPISVYLAQEPIRTEGELGRALIRSTVAFLIAAPLGAAVTGMLAWFVAQRMSRNSRRE
jgi:hypothetical protein